jgi:hypothetical protein
MAFFVIIISPLLLNYRFADGRLDASLSIGWLRAELPSDGAASMAMVKGVLLTMLEITADHR